MQVGHRNLKAQPGHSQGEPCNVSDQPGNLQRGRRSLRRERRPLHNESRNFNGVFRKLQRESRRIVSADVADGLRHPFCIIDESTSSARTLCWSMAWSHGVARGTVRVLRPEPGDACHKGRGSQHRVKNHDHHREVNVSSGPLTARDHPNRDAVEQQCNGQQHRPHPRRRSMDMRSRRIVVGVSPRRSLPLVTIAAQLMASLARGRDRDHRLPCGPHDRRERCIRRDRRSAGQCLRAPRGGRHRLRR